MTFVTWRGVWLQAFAVAVALELSKGGVCRAATEDGGQPVDGPAEDAVGDAAVSPEASHAAGDVPPPEVVPPKLVSEVRADYPPEALAAGLEGTVVLAIAVDATGVVTAADVLQPLGHGLDEAARDAVLRARFEPARRGGRAIPARIRFEYRFRLPAPPAPPPLPLASAPVPPPADEAVTDVTIRGISTSQRLRESAEAVTVIDMQRLKGETSDLGEILARVPGLSVRRSGALGSYARISINGLTDEQIRFYVDGVPLDAAGFGLGLQNTPVNFVDRAEIYKGIVPVRFGADALGGAINLVTLEDVKGRHASGSIELGSFGTTRLTLAARNSQPRTGLFTAASLFLNHADNDYPVDDVPVPNAQGTPVPTRVYLFHNAYDAYGAMVDVGLVDRPWAKRLILRVFDTSQYKQIPSNYVMSVPYGEASYGETAYGANLRYEQPRIAGSPFGANLIFAYGRRATSYRDVSAWVYNWFGQRGRMRERPGEIDQATDQTIRDDKVLARLGGSWTPLTWQEARLTIAPTFDDRTGRDYVKTGRDALAGLRRYLTVTAGGEYEINVLARELQSISFGKLYSYSTWANELLAGGVNVRRDQQRNNFGVGEELRYRVTPNVWAKASYEWTTRFPSPDEVFGNGVQIRENLELRPERSHNANVSLTAERLPTGAGALRGELNLFFRRPVDLIVFLPASAATSIYQNVNSARSAGVEASAGWTSPHDYVVLDANGTWQDLRNLSSTGTFGGFEGVRIPNRPWLFANASARVQKRAVSAPDDELSLGYYMRYVHSYYRSWESIGRPEFKQVIPSQLTHDLVLSYVVRGRIRQTWTLEADNVTDARAYDFYGLQRPGRAFYAKVMADF